LCVWADFSAHPPWLKNSRKVQFGGNGLWSSNELSFLKQNEVLRNSRWQRIKKHKRESSTLFVTSETNALECETKQNKTQMSEEGF
jgi:hypothetical protein